jgi:hypothetical protein
MNKLRDYQLQLSELAANKLDLLGFVYLAMEVRTGKTITALNAAKIYGAKKVLFITKIKAFKSIENDYNNFGFNQYFDISIINAESLHKSEFEADFVISDEHHKYQSFPKPSKGATYFKRNYSDLPIIALSGTMNPENYAQIYHQFWVSDFSPFKHANFYKWHNEFGKLKQKHLGYALVNDYSHIYIDKVKPIIDPYIITYTQVEAGFTSTISEQVLEVEMLPSTYKLIERLKNDLVIQGKEEVILGDTAVKMMSKQHQIFSGTIKFESGKSMVLDYSKAEFIFNRFKDLKIVIFYKFKEELNAITKVYGDAITTDLNEFQTTEKSFAVQIISGREGINLSKAKYIVYYNIDFSAVSYWQSRDRLTTMERTSNEVFWIFAKNGIEKHIYKQVMAKKNFTLSTYKKIKC